ncbi:MAG: TetR/AcrR family transcriptional regulator [Pseudomonadales bacterium]
MPLQQRSSDLDPKALSSGQQARLTRILDAAETSFVANGLSGATMEGIARDASVAKATVYGYLPSKDAAFRAVAERLAGRIEQAALPWLVPRPDDKLSSEGVVSHITNALVAKQSIVFKVVRRSPHADELLLARGSLVAERFAQVDRQIIDGMALVLQSATVAKAPNDVSPWDDCDGYLRIAELCFRGAVGVANSAPSQAQMEEDLRDFVQQFLSLTVG